jgi:hypothetical protein
MTAAVNTSFFALAAPAAASHSLVRRLPAGADVKAGLAAAVERFPFLKSVQLWDEQLRTDSTDTASQTRRTRELSRPVDGKRTPVRAIVLTYADGVADLALVAHRAVVDGRSLAALADLLTDPTAEVEITELDRDGIAPADRTFAPVPWGLGNSERTGHHGVVSVTAPLATKDAIVTALETVLARYGDTSPFAVLVTSPDAADDLTLPEQTSIGLVHSGFGGGYAPHLAPPRHVLLARRRCRAARGTGLRQGLRRARRRRPVRRSRRQAGRRPHRRARRRRRSGRTGRDRSHGRHVRAAHDPRDVRRDRPARPGRDRVVRRGQRAVLR